MQGIIYVALLSFTFSKAGFVFLPNVFKVLRSRFHPAASNLLVETHYSRASPSETDIHSHSIRSCPNQAFGYFYNFPPKKCILKLISDFIRIKTPSLNTFFFLLVLQISVCKIGKQQDLTAYM